MMSCVTSEVVLTSGISLNIIIVGSLEGNKLLKNGMFNLSKS